MNKLIVLLDHNITIRKSKANIWFAIVIIALSLFMLLVGVNIYTNLGYGNAHGVTPRSFPTVVFIVAILLSVFVLIKEIMLFRIKDPHEESIEFRLISFAIFLDIVFFVVAMEPLGYPLTNMIMMFVMYYLSGGKSWIKGVILSVLFTIVSILFFQYYLKLSIPMGITEFLFNM